MSNLPLILLPAYGRKYKTEDEALNSWESGKDFKIDGGPYCSVRDISAMRMDFSTISIRWSSNLYVQI